MWLEKWWAQIPGGYVELLHKIQNKGSHQTHQVAENINTHDGSTKRLAYVCIYIYIYIYIWFTDLKVSYLGIPETHFLGAFGQKGPRKSRQL